MRCLIGLLPLEARAVRALGSASVLSHEALKSQPLADDVASPRLASGSAVGFRTAPEAGDDALADLSLNTLLRALPASGYAHGQ